MDDFALVLNAGSSSLKFCVYRRRPDGDPWRLEARGQIDGIGTTPRFSAKGYAGERLIDTQLDASVRDGRAALDALAVVAARALRRLPRARRRTSRRPRRRRTSPGRRSSRRRSSTSCAS